MWYRISFGISEEEKLLNISLMPLITAVIVALVAFAENCKVRYSN
jgi:hypothetical protein